MSRKYNPQAKGSTAQARAMYADLGLCYECGRQIKSCVYSIAECEEVPHPLFTAEDERDEQMNARPEVSL